MTMQRPTAQAPTSPVRPIRPAQSAPPVQQPVERPSPFRIQHPTFDQHYMKLLLYGDYGVGKTVLAGSADDVPEMRSVLYIDAESGSLALSDRHWLDVVTIKTYSQLARIYEYLRIHCRLRDEGTPEALAKMAAEESKLKGEPVDPANPTRYYTVVIDSLTEVQTYLMYQLLGVDPDKIALDADLTSPEWGEWRESSDRIQLLARQFRDLPMHVIVVLSLQEVQDGQRILKRPNLPGKLATRIQGFWDMVGYYQKVQTQDAEGKPVVRRRLYLSSAQNFQAKNRFRHISADFVDDPTIPKLLNLANQEWAATDRERTYPSNADTSAADSPQSRPAPSPAAAAAPAGTSPTRTTPAGGAGNGRGAVGRGAAVRPVRQLGR